MEEVAAKAAQEELMRKKTELDLQDRYRLDLEREKMVTSASHCSAHTVTHCFVMSVSIIVSHLWFSLF